MFETNKFDSQKDKPSIENTKSISNNNIYYIVGGVAKQWQESLIVFQTKKDVLFEAMNKYMKTLDATVMT